MRRVLAELLNGLGSTSVEKGKHIRGERLYKAASLVDPRWSVPWYNLGLQAKYAGRWEESLRLNTRAAELDPSDEAAWWNLGIAATALRKWPEARRAWKSCGIDLGEGSGEARMPAVSACVRLDPMGSGEVVWAERLDPARMVILSVPLPQSGHRFHDIVLNDGAPNGTRADERGNKVPVFDGLSIWQVSEYSTFCTRLQMLDYHSAVKRLVELCEAQQVGVEDWTTIRFICAECSRGNLSPHKCESKPLEDGSARFGFGARKREDLTAILREWASGSGVEGFEEIDMLLPATSM